jgi:hypothetical protein
MDENPGYPPMAPELPQYWHFSRSPGRLRKAQIAYWRSGRSDPAIVSVEDTACVMQDFVPA